MDGIGIFPVEEEDDALIRRGIAGHGRALDKEAYDRAVRVIVSDGQQDGLLSRFGISPGAVRKKGIVPPGP